MIINPDKTITYTCASDTPDPGSTDIIAMAFTNGVNKVTWHWWGARIYISRNTVRYVANRDAIGGIWVPHPIMSKAASTLGVIYFMCPGGIRFDVSAWNIVRSAIGTIIPISYVRLQ
ncbi:hypothetical protein SAMN04488137_1027 [Fictibacillus solisalsi]|uniref:Uncharacterized protein n=1 Tax=Fictibacillus solisalsi TaxID=459525 RepID=A0A1G9UN08_9BACL|nr:hypothetical protein [Fictibacillus solisalsi]SDM61296.1 hypothetical protein SAMN04488137_1027 [Fictibacillus solisalsi]